jgi:fibronectin-binding autotransporter adhesin
MQTRAYLQVSHLWHHRESLESRVSTLKKVIFGLVSSTAGFRATLSAKSASKKRKACSVSRNIEPSERRRKFLAASLLLMVSIPQFTQVRAYAQVFQTPATVSTLSQSVSTDASGSMVQTVAGIGSGSAQAIMVTTGDMLPGSAKDSQSNSGNNAPVVPPSPAMAQVDIVSGLIPIVATVQLSPDVPALASATTISSQSPTVGAAASATAVATSTPASTPESTSSGVASLSTTTASQASTTVADASSTQGASSLTADSSSAAIPTVSVTVAAAPDVSSSANSAVPGSVTTTSISHSGPSTALPTASNSDGGVLTTDAAATNSDTSSIAPSTSITTTTTATTADATPTAQTADSTQVSATAASPSPSSASAPAVVQPSVANITTANGTLFGSGLGLDLSSTQATIAAPINHPVSIMVGGAMNSSGQVVGGTEISIAPGQMITPAQYVALTQVVQLGSQSIELSVGGTAYGGSFSLVAGQTGELSSLVLPTNVSLGSIGFNSSNPFSVTGNASILGNFFSLQTDANSSSILNFGNLTVSGLLTGDAAQISSGPFYIPSGLFSSSALSLNTLGSLSNFGTINSVGALNITTGGNLTNAGLLSGSTVSLESIGAVSNSGNIFASAGNIGLNSISGNFSNSGMINAIAGSININSATAALPANIAFNNNSGVLSARDSINLRNADFDDKANLSITGGDFLSNVVNLNGGRGEVDLHVNNVSGTVNSTAYIVRLSSASDITVGNTTASGDPTIVSTIGNVTITGDQITAGAPLSVIAYGNILTNPGITISTSGGEVFMAAGVNIQDGGANWLVTGPASPGGGFLDLRGVTNFTTSGASGGNVTLVAYDGGEIDSGRVLLNPATTLLTAGTAGANGNVTIIATDTTSAASQSIQTGTIDTRGAGFGTIGTGNVTLAAAGLPNTLNVSVDKGTGAATGLGSLVQQGGIARDINVAGNIVTRGGTVNLLAGNATSVNGNILVTGQVDNRISSTGAGTGDGGSLVVLQNSANPFVVGGATLNGIGAPADAILNQAGSSGGNGGIVDITNNGAGGITANFGSVVSPIINITAFGAGSGGSFILSAPLGPVSILTTGNSLAANAAIGGGGNGGVIKIEGKTFTASGNPSLNAFGDGAGSGGEVTVQSTQAGNNISVGTTSGDINVDASGGTTGKAGSINLDAGGQLTVDASKLLLTTGTNQNGGTLKLNAGAGGAGDVQFLGSIDVSGNGNGNGGSVTIGSNSGTAFTVSSGGNGITGTITANSGALGGNGGSVSIFNSGAGGITVNSSAAISVAPTTNGAGGKLVLDATKGATPGVVSLQTGTYAANAVGGNNNGGAITIKGSQTLAVGGAVTLSADGTGTGDGGLAQLIATGAGSTATIGGAAGQFTIVARGGSLASASGNGGTVEVRQGGNLTVSDPLLLDATARGTNGDGGSYILEAGSAGSGSLFVSGAINSKGGGATGTGTGNGGSVQLISASTTAFLVNGGATANGISGTVGASGGAAGGSGGSVSIINNNNGGITLTNAGDVTAEAPTSGNGGSIILNAAGGGAALAGDITIPTGTINSNGAGVSANGGTINITGRNFISPGVGPLNLNADAIGNGNGGTVKFTTTAATSDLVVGGGADGSLCITATGGSLASAAGDGGTIAVNAGRNLTVNNDVACLNANPLGTNGKGANLELGAGKLGAGDLFVNIPLNASGVGTGSGGSIALSTNSAAVFNLGTGSVSPGVNGGLSANGGPGAGAGGGAISIANIGAGGINIGATTNVSVLASAAGGPGGSINLNAGNGTLTIPVSGAVGSPTSTLDSSANGPGNFAGGTIKLAGNTIDVPGGNPLNLDVSGSGSGAAGTVDIIKGTGDVSVDGTPGSFTIDAVSGDGANINITTPGDIIFDPAFVSYLPTATNGKGACIKLNSGSNLFVNGSLDANGRGTGDGGCIILTSNSPTSTPFTIGVGAVTNGVNGTLSAASGPAGGQGGIIRVTDNANDGNPLTGGIVVVDTSNLSVSANGGKGGEITLKAANGPVAFSNGGALSANAGGGNFAGGTIAITGTSVNSGGASALNLTANGSGTGNGGSLVLTTTSNTIGDVNLGSGAGAVKLAALSGAGATGNGGAITVNAARNLIADGTQILVTSLASNGSGGTINLNAGTSGIGLLQVNGDINANGTGSGNGGVVRITLPESNPASPLLIGGVGGATQSFVSGSILAEAPGIGLGGTVSIKNTVANAPLNIDFAGTGVISAKSAQGKYGDVVLSTAGGASPAAGESILVKPQSGNVGRIGGFITAIGTSVDITTRASDARIDVGTVTATNGIVNLVSDQGAVGRVSVGESRVAKATGNITIAAKIFEDNGLVTTSNANGRIDVTSPGDLLVTGEGTISTTGAGNTVIRFAAAPSSILALDNNLNIRPTNDAGIVIFEAPGSGGTIIVPSQRNILINDGGEINISTNNLLLGQAANNLIGDSSISAVPVTGRLSNVVIDSGAIGAQDLNIDSKGLSNTIAAAGVGATLTIGPTNGTSDGKNLNFTGSNTILNLNGGEVMTHVRSTALLAATTTIASTMTVSAQANVCIGLDGGTATTPATLLNNGIIQTSGTVDGTHIIAGPTDTPGKGPNFVSVGGGTVADPGLISLTGNPVNGFIGINALDDGLTFQANSAQTLDVGSGAGSNTQVGGGAVSLLNGAQVIASNGNRLDVFTNSLTLEQGSQLAITALGAPINVGAGTITGCSTTYIVTGPLTVTAGSGATAPQINSSNGQINFTPSVGSDLTFANSGAATTIKLNSGTAEVVTNTTNATTTVTSDTTLSVTGKQLTFNVNNGTFANSGQVNAVKSGGTAGQINVLSTSDLTMPNAGNLSVDPTVAGDGGTIVIQAGAPGNPLGILRVGNGTAASSTINANGMTNGNGGTVTVSAGQVVIEPGTPLTVNANAAGTGNGGNISISANDPVNGNVTTGSGSTNINLIARGGTTNGNGGTISISAGNDVTITGSASNIDVSPVGTNGNGGTVNIQASTGSGSGKLTLSTNINAVGNGIGNGGTVRLTNNSSQILVVDQPINVDAGATGNGGSIFVQNYGNGAANGGIDVQTTLNADATGSGNGGTIRLDSSPNAGLAGAVNLAVTPFSANGAGVGNGGDILIKGSQILASAPTPITLVTNAGSTGNGGSITLVAKSSTGDIALGGGAGAFSAAATGGSASGNGGTIIATAGRNISSPGAGGSITVNPLGGNGNGGNITLSAGNAGPGIVSVGSGLSADGIGSGAGGIISISYNDPTASAANRFVVGGAPGASGGLNGTVTANGGATGKGGTITFVNRDGASNTDQNLFIDLKGDVFAAGSAGLGTITFNRNDATNTIVDVSSSAANTGNLTGIVNSSEGTVFINPQGADTTLTAGTILARTGDAELVVSCTDNSQIIVPVGSTVISNTGEAKLDGKTIINSGTIQGQTNVRLEQEQLTNNSVINAVNGSVFIDVCIDNSNLVLNNSLPGSITANNGNINLNTAVASAGGTITVTGTGTLGSNATGNINVGVTGERNTVDITQKQIVGRVAGFGNGTTVTTTAGNLSVGPWQDSGNATFDADGATANLITSGNITSAGALTLDAGTGNSDVIISNGNLIQGSAVNLLSGTGAAARVRIGNGNASVTAATGNLSITTPRLDMAAGSNSITATLGSITTSQPNAASLQVNLGAGSSINASAAGQDITFNGTGININGAGEGLINANDNVALNGGAAAVVANLDEIRGSITGTGSSVSVTTDNVAGNLNIGSATGTLTSTNGNLTLNSGNNVIFANSASATGGALSAQGNNVFFNPAANIIISANNVAGNANTVALTARTGNILNQSNFAVDVQANGSVSGGTINLSAANNVDMKGSGTGSATINANSTSAGQGGTVNVTANTGGGAGTIVSAGTISANGAGAGNGGTANLVANSSATLTVNDTINVSAGTTGNGGNITLRNEGVAAGNGGIVVSNNLIADATGNNTTGGNIVLDAVSAGFSSGAVTIDPITFSANGAGTTSNGGTILVEGSTVNFSGAGSQAINANAGTTGAGGSITLRATTGTVNLGGAPGDVQLFAKGNSGVGGKAIVEAGSSITANGGTGSLDVSATGAGNNKGGSIALRAGTAGVGNVQVNSGLTANGTNNGDGGTISIQFNDPAVVNTLTIGSATGNNFINGDINANSPGTGTGGTITIANLSNGGAAQNLDVNLTNDAIVSASSTTAANSGNINFNYNSAGLPVGGAKIDVAGAGALTGYLNTRGTSVFINPQTAGTTARVGTILATAGDAEVQLDCTTATNIFVDAGKSIISNTGEAKLEAQNITNAGTIQGQTNVRLEQEQLTNNSVINAVNGSVFIDVCIDNNNLVLNNSLPGSITANNGNINLNTAVASAGGTITVTGTGTLGSNATGNINVGVTGERNTVDITQKQIVGRVAGFGNGTTVTTTAGNLSVGPWQDSGNATFDADGATANLITSGNITSAGALTLDAGTGNSDVIISNGNLIQGSAVNLLSGTGAAARVRIGNGNASVTAATGNLSITTPRLDMAAGSNSITATLGSITTSQPNAASLQVNLGAGSSINASAAGQDITFNGTGININGAGEGLINANDNVALNGGAAAVVANLDEIRGSITGTGSSVSVTTDNVAGNLNIGSATGTLTSTNGNLTLNSGNNVIFANSASATGGALSAQGNNVFFNPTANIIISANNVAGNANTVALTARTGNILNQSNFAVDVQANGSVSGGTINLSAANNVDMKGSGTGSATINANSTSAGQGGTVNVTANTGGGAGTIVSAGTISAKGAGAGNGGTANLVANSSATLTVNDTINVSAGTTGNGGNITLRNEGVAAGNGGIVVSNNLTADATGNNTTGGNIVLDAVSAGFSSGAVTIDPITFSANGAGTTSNGGTILVEGSTVIFSGAGSQVINANAGTTGAGGSITLRATTGTVSLGGAAGDVQLFAKGNSGVGGKAIVEAGSSITANGGTGSLDVSATGAGNNKGGSIALRAGTAGVGNVQVNSGLTANGTNNGDGGTISIQFNDPAVVNTLTIGSATGNNFINGDINANSPGTGTGGTITIANLSNGGAAQNLDVNLTNDAIVSASSTTAANSGNINFNYNSAGLPVGGATIDVAGAGALTGYLNTRGTSVFINPQTAGTTARVGTILATAGDAEVQLDCTTATNIFVDAGKSIISNTGEAKLEAQSITNAGTIQGQTNVRLEQEQLTNNSVISAVTGDILINTCIAGNPLNVNVNLGSQLNANNGNIRFGNINDGGTITVSGTGNVGTNPVGEISFGKVGGTPNTVTMNVNQAIGSVTGFGTTVTVQTTTGDLKVGPFTSSAVTKFTANGVGADIITSGDH